MIFKTKQKKTNKKKSSYFLNLFKNISSVIFLIQIFFLAVLMLWYLNNPVNKIYKVKKSSISSEKRENKLEQSKTGQLLTFCAN